MKKTLIILIAVFVCYLINLWLGLLVTLIGGVFLLVKNISAIYALMGTRAYAKSDNDKAIKMYQKAIATGKASAATINNYAMILLRLGNPKAAEEQFDGVINNSRFTHQEKQSAKQYRCMAYLKQGQIDRALSDAKAIFASSKTTISYGLMGYILQLTDTDNSELLALCEEGYDYNSDDRDITDNLIVALIRCNQLERAKELAEELRENHPAFVEAFYHSALIEAKLGNKDKAREYLSHIPECRRSYLTTVSEEEIALLAKEVE